MRVRDVRGHERTPHGRYELSGTHRVLDELAGAAADEVHRDAQIVFGPDDDDRKTELALAHALDHRPRARLGQVRRHDDASARVRVDAVENACAESKDATSNGWHRKTPAILARACGHEATM